MRGSFTERGSFYFPELSICDVIYLSELATTLGSAMGDGLTTLLLKAMEEKNIRVGLLKGADARLSRDVQDRATALGIQFLDGRFEYKARSAFWACTHTLDFLNPHYKDAFLSRMFIVNVDIDDEAKRIAWERVEDKIDRDFESQVRDWLVRCWGAATIDVPYTESVMGRIHECCDEAAIQPEPRQIGDMRRLCVGLHVLRPDLSVAAMADEIMIMNRMNVQGSLSLRDRIIQMITCNPMSMAQIKTTLGVGVSDSAIRMVITRAHVDKYQGAHGKTMYYLEGKTL